MRTALIRFFVLVFAVTLATAAFADDQEKATKEIKKITSISVDSNMRSIVNRTMAEMLNTKRLDLVKERQDMNLNYGGLFLARELAAGGAKMEDIAAQLKAGKKIFDIANDDHANWKQINSEAKKLNKKIDDNIEKYFSDSKKQAALDQADNYDAKTDKVAADADISKDEYAEAQSRYQHLHDMAGAGLPTGNANVMNSGAGAGMPAAK
jgi:predicted component of type VI protein secretion system